MDHESLRDYFLSQFFSSGRAQRLADAGYHPQQFADALAPIAQRHGVLRQLQGLPSWHNVTAEGRWATSDLAADAVMLGVTILEIEAVYRLTYWGKS